MGGVSRVIQSSPGCVNIQATSLCVLPHLVSVPTLSLSTAVVLVAPLNATVQVLKLSMEAKLCLIVRNFEGLMCKIYDFFLLVKA